jgi:hypothetical protein
MKKVVRNIKTFFSASVFFLSSFLCAYPVAAFERIVSPAPGTWANKQPLVLDTSDGAECFYSYSGSDPLTSGFAYDSPVLIDASGSVTVRIVSMDGDKRTEDEVTYTVADPVKNPEGEESSFISLITAQAVCDCTPAVPFVIPSTLSYRMENGSGSFASGAKLTVDPANKLSRCIPCVVTNGADSWRFVIRLSGGDVGVLSKQDVPFELKDWNLFTWTGKKLIWSIDGGFWSANKDPVELDRSIPHTVSWQNVDYESGNPVMTFVIPPIPELTVQSEGAGDKPVIFSLNGDARYRMEIVSSGAGGDVPGSSGMFTQALFDTYAGDEASGTAIFAVYCDGVYQGKLSGSYSIDRKAPASPEIIPSSSGFYARKTVDVRIAAESDTAVYYAVSDPFAISDSDATAIGPDSEKLNGVTAGNFRPAHKDPFRLESGKNTAVFYKVCAYAVDKAGNTSPVAEYKVLIDEYNYWLTGTDIPRDDVSDGSMQHPFTTFEQALAVINNGRFARFHVSGIIAVPSGENGITSNCAFNGNDGTRFVIPSNGTIAVRNASMEATNCTFEKQKAVSGEMQSGSFFVLENAVASFDNTEIVGIFSMNGTVCTAQKSVVYLSESGLTAQADTYACGISAVDSKVTAKKSRVVTIAPTAVDFSIHGGLFEIRNNECKVIARLGRIAELVKTNARMSGNTYTGVLEKKSTDVMPVWNDEQTLTIENTGNSATGF